MSRVTPSFRDRVRHFAEMKFGRDNEEAVAKWIAYWTDTLARNQGLFDAFRSRIAICLEGKKLLDIGCGTGGLSHVVTEEGGFYIGSDFFPAALEMTQAFISDFPHSERSTLILASGTHIPLADNSVDYVVAFDVIEHLIGGTQWQVQFLKDVRRILRPSGLLLLTTPNRLYPFEGHTFTYGPQYLPVWLADLYIRWKNPSFLQEYSTYGQIHLLTPWKLNWLLKQAGLRVIHDFPWGMDLADYGGIRHKILAVLGKLGLSWAATTGFWFSACRTETWEQFQVLKKKEWLRQ